MDTKTIEQELTNMVEIMEQIYTKNMNWFSENDFELYKQLSSCAYAISEDKSKEQYIVEMRKDGSLDILNKTKNIFIYNCDPFEFGDEKTNSITEKKIKQVHFDGVLLGTHITGIIRKFEPKKTTICEANEQIFRCSLYVTDYASLANISNLKFAIGTKCKIKKESYVVKVN